MVRNRAFAFAYRVSAAVAAASGLLCGSGFSSGLKSALFYTQQSNILISGLFIYLAARTGADLFLKGSSGGACYCPRLHMALTLTVSFTLLIFWSLCAPFKQGLKLWTYGNLTLHVFTPVLAIADYFLFCEPGHLKKRDIFLCVLIPATYILIAAAFGFCGMVFYVEDGIARYAPYPFMDFRSHWILSASFTASAAAVFCLCAAALYRLDKRRKRGERK